jgi:predicted RNA-binding Zn ribbon-like protein
MKNEFWQDLLNSDWHDYRGSGNREDRLEDPVWRDRFLAAWRDDVAGVPPEDLVAGLRRLRETIRRLVDAYTAGRSVGRAEWTELNGVLDGSPCVRRMDESRGRPRLRLIPLRRGLPAVLAAIRIGSKPAGTPTAAGRSTIAARTGAASGATTTAAT